MKIAIITHRDCCFPKLRIFRQMALHGERRAKEGFRGRDPDEGPQNILTRNTHNTHTHDVKQDSGENKKISRILQHPQVIFHSCLLSKKLVNHFSPKENSPKPSLPLTSKNRTAQNASKNGVYKTPEIIINFQLTTIQHPLD